MVFYPGRPLVLWLAMGYTRSATQVKFGVGSETGLDGRDDSVESPAAAPAKSAVTVSALAVNKILFRSLDKRATAAEFCGPGLEYVFDQG